MPVATDLMFKTTIYDPVFGFLDYVLKPFGVGQVNWLGTHAVGSIVVVLVWEWAPFMMLIVLAGLQGEDLEALEAAQVDGASTIKTFVYITLPNIKRYMELGVLLGSIYIVQTFGEVFTMTAGGPGTATTNLPYYLYEQVFNNFTVGVGAAAGIIVLILTEIVATFRSAVAFWAAASPQWRRPDMAATTIALPPAKAPATQTAKPLGLFLVVRSLDSCDLSVLPGVLDGPHVVQNRGCRLHVPSPVLLPPNPVGVRLGVLRRAELHQAVRTLHFRDLGVHGHGAGPCHPGGLQPCRPTP